MTQILSEKYLDYSDILIKPKMGNNLSSRKLINLSRHFVFKHGQERDGLPVMSANMATTGNFGIAKVMLQHNMFPTLHKFYSADEIINFYDMCAGESISTDNLFISMGLRTAEADIEKLKTVYGHFNGAVKQNICIDAPNFYISSALDVAKRVREMFPDAIIMAGNIASSDIIHKLLDYVDIVKCGIGSGSGCLTRRQTGCGVPMVSLILETADVSHSVDGHICADGGIVDVGDICKAFCLNSDFVMMGGMFAGTDQAEGDIIEKMFLTNEVVNDKQKMITKQYKRFYGMSSTYANNKFAGGMANYRTSEGREMLVPYTGDISQTIQDIRGGLASCCTYIGATCVKQMSKCATLIMVNNQLNKVFEKYEEKLS